MKDKDDTYTKRPDFIAYNVRDSRDGKGYWTAIGAAWEHKDGRGYDIDMHCMPVNGRVTLREMRQQRQQEQRDDPPRHEERSAEMQPAHDHER